MSATKRTKRSKSSPGSRGSNLSELDENYRPIKIRIFKNGDEYDPGTEISVTRTQFRHWLALLDFIGKRIDSLRAIHYLYTIKGREVREFKQLRDGKEYVAVHDRFQKVKYKSRIVEGGFKVLNPHLPRKDAQNLHSPESIEIYLTKMGFKAGAAKPPKPKSKGKGTKKGKKKAKQRSQSLTSDLNNSGEFHAETPSRSSGTPVGSAKSQRTIPASAKSRESTTSEQDSPRNDSASEGDGSDGGEQASRATSAQSQRTVPDSIKI